MKDRTHNGVPFCILNVIDEFTRECLTGEVARRLTLKDALEVLFDLFLERGVPVHIRSDNGSELIAPESAQVPVSVGMSNRCLSNRAVSGRMATSNPSMEGCVMSCFQEKSSMPSRRRKF
jgi:hypothetical protein